MRIFDPKSKKPLRNVLIMLTPDEVRELMGSLESLTSTNDLIHVPDEQFRREKTIGIYSQLNIHNFSDEVIRLIQGDE